MADREQSWMQIVAETLQMYPGLLLVIVGLAAIVVATGAVPYAPVQGEWQKILGGVGGVLVVVGLIWLLVGGPGPKPYGVKIVSPPANAAVGSSVMVTGTVRHIPRMKELWLVRIYRDQTYYPAGKVSVGRGQREWHEQHDLFSADTIGAFVVGQAGMALISQFKDAEKRHNRWMDDLNVLRDAKERYLPNLKMKDVEAFGITVCDTVKVTRTQSG